MCLPNAAAPAAVATSNAVLTATRAAAGGAIALGDSTALAAVRWCVGCATGVLATTDDAGRAVLVAVSSTSLARAGAADAGDVVAVVMAPWPVSSGGGFEVLISKVALAYTNFKRAEESRLFACDPPPELHFQAARSGKKILERSKGRLQPRPQIGK